MAVSYNAYMEEIHIKMFVHYDSISVSFLKVDLKNMHLSILQVDFMCVSKCMY